MLKIQHLLCRDQRNYKGCRWYGTKLRYPDDGYRLLLSRLKAETLKTGIAYRILHDKEGLLVTIKRGHDNKLFLKEVI